MGEIKIYGAEREVLELLTREFLTPAQIASRRKTTQQAISKIICRLRKKGLLKYPFKKGCAGVSTPQPFFKFVRLHGLEFHIKILFKNKVYDEQRSVSNIISLENNTIRLFSDSLEVYISQSFLGKSSDEVSRLAFEYLNSFLVKLENRLKIIILKSGSANINLVNAHFAETDNEVSKDYHARGDKLKVYTRDDGKLWFLIDNSFNLHEAEALHPQTSKQDFDRVISVLNDYRNEPGTPVPSSMYKLLLDVAVSPGNPGGSLVVLQNKIRCLNDVIIYKDEVTSLSEDDKIKFTEWLFKEFGIRADSLPVPLVTIPAHGASWVEWRKYFYNNRVRLGLDYSMIR